MIITLILTIILSTKQLFSCQPHRDRPFVFASCSTCWELKSTSRLGEKPRSARVKKRVRSVGVVFEGFLTTRVPTGTNSTTGRFSKIGVGPLEWQRFSCGFAVKLEPPKGGDIVETPQPRQTSPAPNHSGTVLRGTLAQPSRALQGFTGGVLICSILFSVFLFFLKRTFFKRKPKGTSPFLAFFRGSRKKK